MILLKAELTDRNNMSLVYELFPLNSWKCHVQPSRLGKNCRNFKERRLPDNDVYYLIACKLIVWCCLSCCHCGIDDIIFIMFYVVSFRLEFGQDSCIVVVIYNFSTCVSNLFWKVYGKNNHYEFWEREFTSQLIWYIKLLFKYHFKMPRCKLSNK